MTAIVPTWIKTKKALKDAIINNADITFTNPTPWGNEYPTLKGMTPNQTIFCTNHPRRSWFAQITCTGPNTYKVS